MKFFLLCFLTLPLFAVKLVDYNIYDRNDRVDLMLSFDNAYNGKISQTKDKNFILLTFSKLTYSKDELKNLSSKLVDRISISSKNNDTYIMLKNKQNISLNVSSINDKFGVRIRVTQENKQKKLTQDSILKSNHEKETPFEFKDKNLVKYDYTNYILVMVILIILLVILWWLKNSLISKKSGISRDFRMVFQRFLDKNNQLVVFEYDHKRYTMIIGNSNVVLESMKIEQEKIDSEEKEKNFDSFFEENKKRIQNLIEQRQKK